MANIKEVAHHAGLSVASVSRVMAGHAGVSEATRQRVLAAVKALDLDPETVNVNGSGCSLGHPIGCTGARMIVTMMNELERTDSRYGVVAMCAAGGMGSATVVERI